jgi:hypothetical protein
MDLTSSAAPRTDQQNFLNYKDGPKTVTISHVKRGTDEQPVEVHLVEFPGQPWKPSKGMINVLMGAWGKESDAYAGRKITLYGDPKVRFGSDVLGGIRISHLSHIDKPVRVLIRLSKGKTGPFTVEPLAAAQPKTQGRDWIAELKIAGMDCDAIGALGRAAKTAGADDTIMRAITDAYNSVPS